MKPWNILLFVAGASYFAFVCGYNVRPIAPHKISATSKSTVTTFAQNEIGISKRPVPGLPSRDLFDDCEIYKRPIVSELGRIGGAANRTSGNSQ